MDGLFDEFKSSPPSVLTLHLPGCSPTLEPCGGPAEGASSPLNPPSLPACKYHGRGEEGTSIQLRYPSDSFNYFLPVVNWCQSVQPQKPSEDISYFTCVHIYHTHTKKSHLKCVCLFEKSPVFSQIYRGKPLHNNMHHLQDLMHVCDVKISFMQLFLKA